MSEPRPLESHDGSGTTADAGDAEGPGAHEESGTTQSVTSTEPGDAEEWDRPLSAPVRRRALELAVTALDAMAPEDVPAHLRKVARFAPRRRTQGQAGEQLAAALENTGFRSLVLSNLDDDSRALATAVGEGAPPSAADTTEVAALAFLARRPGWTGYLRAAAAEESAAAERGEVQQLRKDNERLSARLEREKAEASSRAQLASRRIADLERDLATVRNELRGLQAEESSARQHVQQLQEQLDVIRRDAATAAEQHRSEQADAQRSIDALTSELVALRGVQDESEALMSARAKVLLDALVDAATGLRREWGQVGDERRPGDFVADAAGGSEPAHRPLLSGVEDLRLALSAPAAHLIVDGYNLTKQQWPTLTLKEQRAQLVTRLGALAAQTGAEVTVVFDGVAGVAQPVPRLPRVRVRFSKAPAIADEVIRGLVAAEPDGRIVIVASSDQEVAAAARRPGHRSIPSQLLADLLTGGSA